MGTPKMPKNTKHLARDHAALYRQLQEAPILAARLRGQVSQFADQIICSSVTELLSQVPVEELNREKRGIRIKTLKNLGYQTIADILSSPVNTIAQIDGISDSGACEIREIAESIRNQARKGVRVRLSLDHQSPEYTNLVIALSQWMAVQRAAEYSLPLISLYDRNIRFAISDLAPCRNVLRWLFASRQEKQKAVDAYAYLYDQINGSYGRKARETIPLLRQISGIEASRAWADFKNNSIAFYNTLEAICPGVLGTDDDLYGLPEDLARQIQQEQFQPEGLRCTLRRYQQWGVRYILHQGRVLLGDEMGLGKTVQAIAVMVSLRNTGKTHFLVICPASVIENWCREICKHSNLRVVKIHGSDRMESQKHWIASGGVAVTTYETTGIFQLQDSFRFSTAIVDEAHYIKNPEAQRTANVTSICRHAERLLFMTGTALENRVEEMISLISILQPRIAAEVKCMMSLAASAQFREKVAPVYYRRKREDVLTELPGLIEKEEWCILSPREEEIYEQAVLGNHYAAARRVSWSTENASDSSKAQRMLELIEQAGDEDRKVIVFSFFLDTLKKVTDLLGPVCLPPINGGVPPRRRQEIVDEFDRAPAGTVLTAQIQAGGTGLNIQAASVVILCEPQLKPSTENQAISRAYRMGQTRNVLVYRLLCKDTVDERITELLRKKQAEFDAFADESVAGAEDLELDGITFGSIMKEEAARIQRKNAPDQS